MCCFTVSPWTRLKEIRGKETITFYVNNKLAALPVCVCVCACMHVHACVCARTCVWVSVCMHMCMHVYLYMHAHVCMCVYVCKYTHERERQLVVINCQHIDILVLIYVATEGDHDYFSSS